MTIQKNPAHDDLYYIHAHGIDVQNREIYLHSCLDGEEEAGVDYRSAIAFEKNLRYLCMISKEPILIHMHLPGGDWEDCMAIYDAIQTCKVKTTILAYGKVQSASSVILQAPNHRIIMPNTNVLIHYGSISLDSEHSKAASNHVQWNERECEKMVNIFVDRCINSPLAEEKNWKKVMVKKHIVSQLANRCDWILTAEEAVYYGFADAILGESKYPSIQSLKK